MQGRSYATRYHPVSTPKTRRPQNRNVVNGLSYWFQKGSSGV